MRNFRKITVWNRSLDFVKSVYRLTNQFPKNEEFGLISQMRRAAVSIPSNIAEGCARNSDKEFKRFLEISLGSAFELETQIIVSKELGITSEVLFEDLLNEIQEIQKMLNGFISKLKAIS